MPAGRAFTSMTKVQPGHEAELADYLTGLGTNIKSSTDIVFSQLRTVHFLRWVIVHTAAGEPWLAFESSHDGSLEDHLDELVRVGRPGVHAICRHCVGYPLRDAEVITPSEEPLIASFLRRQSIECAAYHVGIHDKTAQRIRRESEVREAIGAFVDQRRASGAWSGIAPHVMYDEIVGNLGDLGWLADAREQQPRPPMSRVLPWVLRAVLVGLVLLPFLVPLYILLRIHESVDSEEESKVEPPTIRELAMRE